LSVLSAAEGYVGEDCNMFNNMFYNQTLDHTFWGKNVPPGVTAIGLLSGAWMPASNPPEIVYSSPPGDLGTTDITIRLPSSTTTQVISAVLTSNGMDFVAYGHAYPTALWEPFGTQPTYDGGIDSLCRITWNDWVIFEQIDGNVTVYRNYSYTYTTNTLRPALSGGQNGIMKVVLETVNSSLSAGLRFWYD